MDNQGNTNKIQEQQKPEVKRPLKINSLIFQVNPKYKDIEVNISRISISFEKYSDKDQLDIVMLPEMALTGYNFKNVDDIKPYLEEQKQGPTFQFLSTLAKRLKSYVFCGYPEIFNNTDTGKVEYYNACYILDREGNLLSNYRKTQLFETDKTWAAEGQGFSFLDLQNVKGETFRASLGICMDINPYEFLDNSKFEWANYCLQNKVDVLIFISAWNDHETEHNTVESINSMMNYWIWRLSPLLNKKGFQKNYKSLLFLCADRVGVENNAVKDISKNFKEPVCHFIGCSCAIKINPIECIYYLDKKKEGIMKIEATLE